MERNSPCGGELGAVSLQPFASSWHTFTMPKVAKPPSVFDATSAETTEPSEDVRRWQEAKIKAGLKDAEAGQFADPDQVRAVVRKYVSNA